MPELPEVEVTRRYMASLLEGRAARAVRVYERRLRWPVPRSLAATLAGQRLQRMDRRAKYLLWRFEHGVLISHLGMSGSWRIYPGPPDGAIPARGRHDHVDLEFDSMLARLTDPRRFGALLWHPASAGEVERHPLLAGLGPEPLEADFDGSRLFQATRGRTASIKQLVLAGDAVVGVGNIYASESLFDAGIDPRVPAGRLSRARCTRLAQAIRAVLTRAIDAGGSTLRDYASADGAQGQYPLQARVYGRDGLECLVCGRPIRRIVQGQRATYWCARCQR
ncbi:MAG: bifunctional DNA-formamidopyrimidine glycosylase/DNA-(apurinic or apyrimidinic site) lyase [Burkholderiaceae bacterium]|nr:bifunctional DNA-formamidopyrimidine glycosylase/DNA-(apurinic or apyrimidinic site) lyase [Burkholderiaceae bacterium]